MKNYYWKIVKNDEKKIFNIVGFTDDDTNFSNTIAELQKNESIRCETHPRKEDQSIQELIHLCTRQLKYKYDPNYHNDLKDV